MSLGLKPYSAYRDSGVEWMGQVPHGWQTSKVKRLAREGHKTFVDGDWIESPYIASEGIRLIQTGNIGVGVYREQGFRYISEDTFTAFGCTEFRPNDVLICRLGEPVSRACLAPDLGVRMITSVDVCILKPREDALAAYIVYAMSSSRYLDWVNSLVRGSTRDRVSRSMLGSFVLPLPPLDEQRFIVRYLDYMDRRIRRYILTRQKLVKLLEEQKQVIVRQAVTGQIDVRTSKPYPAYKDSGAEWLGRVPEHWDVVPLKFLSRRIQNGATPPTGELRFYEDGTVPWYGPSSCAPHEEVEKPVRCLAETAFAEGRARLIRGPALLVVVIGATAGRMALLTRHGSTNQQITSYELLAGRVKPKFLLRQCRGAERWLRLTASTATIPILDANDVSRLPVALPPLPEQERIMQHTEENTTRLNRAIERAEREMALLREYRTRLTADVVTGRLDTRDAAASLPEEVDAQALSGDETLPAELEVDEVVELEASLEELEA